MTEEIKHSSTTQVGIVGTISGNAQEDAMDLVEHGTLLPPPPNACQQCAREHEANLPHDQQSLYWQYWFRKQHGRWPRWPDAMRHCDEWMRNFWHQHLRKLGMPEEDLVDHD